MEKLPIEAGQVWRREPSESTYEVKEVHSGAGSNIRLQKTPGGRVSWISESGLRAKFTLVAPTTDTEDA